MAEADARVPAGWYPDPLGLPQLRWWDNHTWTEHTSDAREPMVGSDAESATPVVEGEARTTLIDDGSSARRERHDRTASAEGRTGSTTSTALLDDPSSAASTGRARHADPLVPPTQDDLDAFSAPVASQVVDDPASGDAGRTAGEGRADARARSPRERFAEFVPAPSPSGARAGDVADRFGDLLAAESGFAAGVTTGARPASASGVTDAAGPLGADPLDSAPTANVVPGRISVNDAAVWILALLPVAQIFIALFGLLAQNARPSQLGFAIVLFAVPWAAGMVLAAVDAATLRRRGIRKPASWAFALLGAPVYLIARLTRTLRATGRGFGPLGGWVASAAAAGLSVLLVPGLLIALAPAAFARQAEDSLESRASVLGADIQVSCPDEMPFMIGGEATCIANRGPLRWGVSVRLDRANGWIDWHVEDWGIFPSESAGAATGG